MWTVVREIREELETTLGARVPDPSVPEFDQFLARLQREHPALARKLLEGLRSAPTVTLPSEAFVRRMHRRRVLGDLFVWMLCKPTWPDGVVLDKRRVVGLVLVLFAAFFLPAVYLMNARALSGRRLPRPARLSRVADPLAPVPGSRIPSSSQLPRPIPRTLELSLQSGSVPVPLAPSHGSPGGTLGTILPELLAPSNALRQSQAAPSTGNLGSSLLPPPQPVTEASVAHVFAFVAADDRVAPSRVFVFVKDEAAARDSNTAELPGLAARAARPRAEESSAELPAGDALPPFPNPPSTQLAAVPWQAGQILVAHLVTGIAMTPGLEPSPVLAASDRLQGCGRASCPQVTWLGQATYGGGNRVQVQFTAAFIDGRAVAVRAQALAVDMVAGLPATVSTQTPALAAQVVSAAVAAAGDYLKALSEQQKVTITNGWLTVTESGSPEFWTHVLGRVAALFGVPSPGPATVQVAEVKPATELRLLILAMEGR